jgi:hypothetical protein
MDQSSASERSLSFHLRLVACRSGRGNNDLITELMRAVYLTWYLQRAGYGHLPVEQLKIAEYAAESTFAHAHETGEWRPDPDMLEDFEALLALQ